MAAGHRLGLVASDVDGADAAALDTITKLCTSLVEATGLRDDLIDNAVVGVPAVVEEESGTLRLTNVRGLEGRHFRADLIERLGLPVTLESDINLAARGEQWPGVARGVEDFVFLSIGTGLGAGLVLRGELHRGRNGAAGEADLISSGRGDDIDPCASAVSELRRGSPPRVEVSGLGDAAVLTGALAVGLGIAQESVFANRRAAGSAALDRARG